jgi:D-threonate/D-erythronate kinase
MTVLRLIADDLTGALDTAAEFASLCGPVPVLRDARAGPGSLAIATGTREWPQALAVACVAEAAPLLAGADIAFKKLDSLLRGHPMAELGACLRAGDWHSVVLAPAFPAQGRVTRGGRQFVRDRGGWREVADLVALCAAAGLPAQCVEPGAALPEGITLFDAETEDDMARIVACGRAVPGPMLWCGSGGLGRALAAAAPIAPDTGLRGPVLGLFGSDQDVTRRQLAACGVLWREIAEDVPAASIAATMARGAVLVSLALPDLRRRVAARRIAGCFARLLAALPPPGTLIVAGGETLGAVLHALGAEGEATGLVMPGVPRGVLRGGRWDGVDLVSKSGAFGGDMLWHDLLAAQPFLTERQTA